MSSIDQKRMLKLAGLLKEGLEEWPRGLSEVEDVPPVTDEEAREKYKASLHRGFDDDDDFSDYVRDVDRDMPTSFDYEEDEDEYKEGLAKSLHSHAGQDDEELPVKEPVASAQEEELERMPKSIGMGRGASLEETYIDNMKEVIHRLVHQVLLEKAKSYKGKSMRLGGGGRFAKMVDSLKKSGKSEEQAKAIAYKAGVKKYGKGKMTKMAAAGKKRKKD